MQQLVLVPLLLLVLLLLEPVLALLPVLLLLLKPPLQMGATQRCPPRVPGASVSAAAAWQSQLQYQARQRLQEHHWHQQRALRPAPC